MKNIFSKDILLNKLVLLFFIEKMEIPVTENTIVDICTNKNEWINYMECMEVLNLLVESGLLYKNKTSEDVKYMLTNEGTSCLSFFYGKIPLAKREEISNYVKENRSHYKRSQEYLSDYQKNPDGSYNVKLKIHSSLESEPLFELFIKTSSRQAAIEACKKWVDNAHILYEYIYENLIDGE